MPRRRSRPCCLPRASRGLTPPGPSAGVGRACARTCGFPLALHNPQRNSEGEREGLWRLRAVCRRAGPRGRGSSSPRDACASSRLHFLFTAVTTGAASRLQRGARVHRPAPLSSPVAGYPRECEPPGSQTPPGKSRPLGSRRGGRTAQPPECGSCGCLFTFCCLVLPGAPFPLVCTSGTAQRGKEDSSWLSRQKPSSEVHGRFGRVVKASHFKGYS